MGRHWVRGHWRKDRGSRLSTVLVVAAVVAFLIIALYRL